VKTRIVKLKNQVPPAPVKDTEAQLKGLPQENPLAIAYCSKTELRRQDLQDSRIAKTNLRLKPAKKGGEKNEKVYEQSRPTVLPWSEGLYRNWDAG
jgi:hypothetical protein